MDLPWTLGFIGAGVMADVMIGGLLDQGVLPAGHILASDPSLARLDHVHLAHGIRTGTDNVATATQVQVLVLSVKPQNLAEVLDQLRGHVPPDATVLSIVAGANLGVLRRGLGHPHIVRCMPNLPCRIRQGMTVWTSCGKPSNLDRVRSILSVMGREVLVDHEAQVDQATAVNGTGPAIVAQFVKAMVEGAAFIGEPRGLAHQTVLATLIGTAQMIQKASEDGTHVAQIIDEVTSPGGTTSRALQVMKQGRFSAVVTEAIDAAHQRTLELGRGLERELSEDDGSHR